MIRNLDFTSINVDKTDRLPPKWPVVPLVGGGAGHVSHCGGEGDARSLSIDLFR